MNELRAAVRAGLVVLGVVAFIAHSWVFVAAAGLLVLTFWHPGKAGRR